MSKVTFVNTNRHRVYVDDPNETQESTKTHGLFRFDAREQVTLPDDDPLAVTLRGMAGVVEATDEVSEALEVEAASLAGHGPGSFPAYVAPGDEPSAPVGGQDLSELNVKELRQRAKDQGVYDGIRTGKDKKGRSKPPTKKQLVNALEKASESGGTVTSDKVPKAT